MPITITSTRNTSTSSRFLVRKCQPLSRLLAVPLWAQLFTPNCASQKKRTRGNPKYRQRKYVVPELRPLDTTVSIHRGWNPQCVMALVRNAGNSCCRHDGRMSKHHCNQYWNTHDGIVIFFHSYFAFIMNRACCKMFARHADNNRIANHHEL